MQPVAEIQEPVIQRDEDISNKAFKKIFSRKVRKWTGPATKKTTSLLSFKILVIVASEKYVKIWIEQTQSSLETHCLLKGGAGSTSIPRTIPEYCELMLKDPNPSIFLEKLTSSIEQMGAEVCQSPIWWLISNLVISEVLHKEPKQKFSNLHGKCLPFKDKILQKATLYR